VIGDPCGEDGGIVEVSIPVALIDDARRTLQDQRAELIRHTEVVTRPAGRCHGEDHGAGKRLGAAVHLEHRRPSHRLQPSRCSMIGPHHVDDVLASLVSGRALAGSRTASNEAPQIAHLIRFCPLFAGTSNLPAGERLRYPTAWDCRT